MTTDEAKDWFKRVRLEAEEGDNEGAHAAEDAFYGAVLRAIASGEPGADPRVLAQIALGTQELDFERWYA